MLEVKRKAEIIFSHVSHARSNPESLTEPQGERSNTEPEMGSLGSTVH